MYNKEYITEKLDKAIKSLTFLQSNLKDAPAWMHCTDDDPLKAETAYTMKQLQIITDHIDARDRAEKRKAS